LAAAAAAIGKLTPKETVNLVDQAAVPEETEEMAHREFNQKPQHFLPAQALAIVAEI